MLEAGSAYLNTLKSIQEACKHRQRYLTDADGRSLAEELGNFPAGLFLTPLKAFKALISGGYLCSAEKDHGISSEG
jgi:hypothetical protein